MIASARLKPEGRYFLCSLLTAFRSLKSLANHLIVRILKTHCLRFNKKFAIIPGMRSRRQGIVLISILVLTLLATFFIGALIQMNPERLRRTVHDEKRDRAAMAARAGVDYALNCLKSNVEWKADGAGVTIELPDLVVREDRGNVLGWIRTDGGPWTGFRMRFNAQDGAAGSDDLDDPQYLVHSREISLNNLDSDVEFALPIGEGANFEPAGNFGTVVPGRAVGLVVEGVALPGLDPRDPESLAQAPSTHSRVVEGLYAVTAWDQSPAGGAVLSSAGEVDMMLQSGGDFSLKAASDNIARVRTKNEFTLHRSSGGSSLILDPDDRAEILVSENSSFQANTVDNQTFVGGAEAADDPFLEVSYDRIKNSKQSTVIEIPAGTYVFSDGNLDSGGDVTSRVHYYELSWADYAQQKRAGTLPPPQTLPPEFASRVTLDAPRDGSDTGHPVEPRDTVVFERDVQVTPVGELNDLTIAPERGARSSALPISPSSEPLYISPAELRGEIDLTVPQDIEIVFQPAEGVKTAYLRAEGDIFLGTNLTGKAGGVVSGSNLDLVGLGVDLETKTGRNKDGLTLYAKGGSRRNLPSGINISTYDERRNKYWDIDVSGSIFTKEELNLSLGVDQATSTSGAAWGTFRFEGAIVSLGDAVGVLGEVGDNGDFEGGWHGDSGSGGEDTEGFNGGDGDGDGDGGTDGFVPESPISEAGPSRFVAKKVSLFYEPRYLAGMLDNEQLDPPFAPISVIER